MSAWIRETSRRSVLLSTSAVLFGMLPRIAANQQEFVVRSRANLVVLDVSVTGSDGTPVSGLVQRNFQVSEDGKRQTIKQFSADELPVSIGFVVDMSGSMRSKLDGVRRATSTFLEASNARDEYFLIGFNDSAWVGLPTGLDFSKNRDDIRKALLGVRSAGKTALYDGIVLALTHVGKSRYERRVLVLITDGKDNASSIRLSEALQFVRASPVTIYTIGLFDEDDQDANRGVLKQFARTTGGRYYAPKTPEMIGDDCAAIARDIRARYTMAYTPPAESKGPVRKIKIEVIRDQASSKAVVRTRSEYILESPSTR